MRMKLEVIAFVGFLFSGTLANAADSVKYLAEYKLANSSGVFVIGFIPDSTHIRLGEPLNLTFKLENRSDKPYSYVHVRNEQLRIDAISCDGDKNAVGGGIILDGNGHPKNDVIFPGQTYVVRILLSDRVVLKKPGEYIVTAHYSPTVTVDASGRENFLSPGFSSEVVTKFKLIVKPARTYDIGKGRFKHTVGAK